MSFRGTRRLGFQADLPVTVKVPFSSGGRKFRRGDRFDWHLTGIAVERVRAMFYQGMLRHDAKDVPKVLTARETDKGGDTLDTMTVAELRDLCNTLCLDTARDKDTMRARIRDYWKGLKNEEARIAALRAGATSEEDV